jgi:hypothetical protein
MVLDEASLVVEGPAGPKEGDLQRIEEGQLRYISAASFRSRPMSGRIKWNEPMTQRFYEGLSYFGTDFGLISLLFPGLTRHQIKLKFNAEERARGAQVNEALMHRRIPDQSVKDRMRGLLTKKLEVSEVLLPLPQPQKKAKTGPSSSAPGQPAPGLDTVQEEDESGTDVDVPPPVAGPSVVDQAIQETNDRAFEEAMQTITSAKPSSGSGPSVIRPKVAVRSRPRKKPAPAPVAPAVASDSMEE